MRISDIKGERSLDVIADAMELVDELSADGRLDELVASVRQAKGDGDAVRRALCSKLPPLIREHKRRVVSLMASAAGVDPEEYAENGELLKDLVELLTSDVEALGFLAKPDAGTE